mgnify:CR=1 FL=1
MNQMNIQISLAELSQASAIAEVLQQAFLEYEPIYTPEAFAATTPTAEQIQKRWDEGPVWVALQSTEVVGTIAAVPKHNKSLYVRSIAILPAARGQNVGKALLQEMEQFARDNNFQRMFLSTTPFLERAIRLYQNFGFKQTDEGPHELFGTPVFTMEKTLHAELKGNS